MASYQLSSVKNGLAAENNAGRNSDEAEPDQAQRDHHDLLRVGKRPVLFRAFGFMSILGFNTTSMVTWECSLLVLDIALADGGPSGVLYGFLLAWFGTACVYACLSELSSMAPTSSGQYHWVSMLAPARCRNYPSFITGWLTVVGWQANVASAFYISAQMTLSVARLNNLSVPDNPWQVVLLYWALILWSLFINAVVSRVLPAFESAILVLHIICWPAILIPLLILGQHVEPSLVFENFRNEGMLYTQGLSLIVGISGTVLCFTGGDGTIHMSEEIRGASAVVPRAVMTGSFLNGALGFSMLVALFFVQGDLNAHTESPIGFAFMDIFLDATGSREGATAMIAFMLVVQFSCPVSLMAATSRMTWSFARDRGLPGWKYISRVDERTSIPVISVVLTAFISVLFSLIIFGSTTAFNNIVSISNVGLFASYLMATGLLLYRRVTGGIIDTKKYEGDVVNTVGAQLVWGPWRMPKLLGLAVNIYACCWALFEVFFNLWPNVLPVSPQNMQYSVVVAGGVTILASTWYLVGGRKTWSGPIIEAGQRENHVSRAVR